jgi:transposase
MQLYDSGMFLEQIAKTMHFSLGYVRRLVEYHFESTSQPKPDGRKRRATLPRKQTRECLYREKSEAAMALWNEGKPYLAIAQDLNCSDYTARKAVEYAHGVRGLVVPTARQRRQQALERVKALYDAGLQYKEIATTLGYTTSGVRGMLKDWARAHREQLPDGRTRRHGIDRKDCDG